MYIVAMFLPLIMAFAHGLQNTVAQSLDDKKITSDNWLCIFFSSLWHLLKEKIATNCIDTATSQAVWLRKIFKDQWEKRLAAS